MHLRVGMSVIVDVSALTKNGAPLGTIPASGTIVSVSWDTVTVLLDALLAGVSIVTVPRDRLVLVGGG